MPVDAGGCRWMPVDAGGCRWMPVDAGGCRWMPVIDEPGLVMRMPAVLRTE
jgi:hypothetical protein